MIHYERAIIARQALWPMVAVIVLASIVHYFYGWLLAIGLWLLLAVLAFLYRDPQRQVPPLPLAILAPIDGKVTSISEERDPYLNREARRVKMRGNLWGAYPIRSAMEGKVNNQWFGTLPDDSKNKDLYKKSGIPTFAQWTQSDEGDDIVTTITPRFARRSSNCIVHSGERIGQGKRCGFVTFGVNAEIFLPLNCRIDLKPGDNIQAGISVVATLVR
ncbi:MAG: phosphatidylserine decarboxylase [Gammaproteobacteria bacterium]|nr:phosphatidylserine decarboxylase [Gammaproteobacteria bacterium]